MSPRTVLSGDVNMRVNPTEGIETTQSPRPIALSGVVGAGGPKTPDAGVQGQPERFAMTPRSMGRPEESDRNIQNMMEASDDLWTPSPPPHRSIVEGHCTVSFV